MTQQDKLVTLHILDKAAMEALKYGGHTGWYEGYRKMRSAYRYILNQE